MIPARTDTKYFHWYIYGKAEIRFVEGRLKFTDEDGNSFGPAPFPSMVVIYKGQPVKHGQWIRVEDEKPDTGQYVLVNHKDGVMQCAQYLISGYDDRELWVLDHYYKEQGEITHWMPLPEPPEEQYKCRYADDNGVCDKFTESEEIVYCTGRPCLYYTSGGE